jgi:hypothetical protein
MKNLLRAFLALFVLVASFPAAAQMDIYAIYRSGSGPWNDPFVPVARFGIDSAVPSNVDTVFGISGVALSSSTFLDGQGEYWFSGPQSTPPMDIRLVGVDVNSGQYNVGNALQGTVNEYQYDMQTQILYGLGNYIYAYDSLLNIPDYRSRMVRVDFTTGTLTEIVKFSHITGVVSGNSTFDSDSSYYYFQGITDQFQNRLYKVQASNGAIVDSLDLITPANTYFNEWEYDQATGVLYGLYRDNNANTISLASLDFGTGAITTVTTIPNIMGLTPGASDFDHLTGQFIMLGFMTNGDLRFIRVDVNSGLVFQSPPINGYVIEFEIDNSRFASNRYGVSSVPEWSTASARLFPNPSGQSAATLQSDEPCTYTLYNAQGQAMQTSFAPATEHSLSSEQLAPGIYLVELSTGQRLKWMVK